MQAARILLKASVLSLLIGVLPAHAALTHRYSFNESDGSVAADSIVGAHGTLESGAFFTGAGSVEFDGTAGYVDLPDNLVAGYTTITVEAWVNDFGSPDWARVFDFGRRNGTVGEAWLYLGYPPAAVTGGQPSIRGEANPPAPSIVNAPRPSTFVTHHVVLTVDGPSTTARIYIDGVLSAIDRNFAGTPATVGDMPNVWIGQSQFQADARFFGQMDEFRIWNQALSAAEVAASHAAGPDTVDTDAGALTSVTMTVATPMVVGGVQTPGLTGQYENLPNPLNLAAEDGVVYTSSDTNVIVINNGVLQAVATGTATIEVSFGGKTDSKAVTVITESASLVHRYSFGESGGSTFNDSIGSAHGTVISGTLGGGRLDLNGLGDYAMLPAGILDPLTNATFQFWVRWDGNPTGPTRFFDFGTNNGTAGVRWIQISPNANNVANRLARFVISDGSGAAANASIPTPTNQEICVTAVFNDSANVERVYFDGVMVAQLTGMTKSLSSIPNPFNYIGKSQFSADPTLDGAFNEFRIFNGAMTDFEIAVSSAGGPDSVVTNPGSLLALRIVAASTNLDAHGASTSFAVYADYVNVTNVNVTSQAGLELSSSAPNVVVATAGGQLRPTGAGTAVVTASFQSLSGTLPVSVSDSSAWPTLAHRYTFNDGSGTTVADSIGNAHGTVIGTGSWTSSRLVLPGGPSAGFVPGINPDAGYVDLPNDLVTALPPETSFEFWVQWDGGGIWQRVFDFGTSTGGEDNQGTGLSYLMLTPSGAGGVARAEYFYNSISTLVLGAPSQFTPGTLTHVVVTHDATRQFARLYINGQRIATGTVTNLLSDLPGANIWLGRAQWADPYFDGEYEEFRIWNGALTDAQVTASFAAGPNVVPGPSLRIRRDGGNVSLVWPANATSFELQSSSALGTGANWTEVVGAPTVVNGENVLTLPPAGTALFYRLAPL